jgi:hypothetical protein
MIQIYQKIKIVESICRSDLNLDKKDQYIYIYEKSIRDILLTSVGEI